MRRNLLASTALTTSTTLLTGAALAANLPLKAPPPPAPVPFSWTGCYVGGNAGWASTSFDQSAAVPAIGTFSAEHSFAYDSSGRDNGFIGGVQGGCNLQFDPKWVVGLEGDLNWLKASRTVGFGGEDTIRGSQTASLRWLDTVRVNFGYAWDQRLLIYATGGLAVGRVTSSVSASEDCPGCTFAGTYSATRTGWAAGFGFAYAFTDRVSGKLEYLHFDLGNANYLVAGFVQNPPVPGHSISWPTNVGVAGDIVRVGLNWKFYP